MLNIFSREPLRYVNRNVHSHTATVLMVGSATVAVCGVCYYQRTVALAIFSLPNEIHYLFIYCAGTYD